MFCVALGGRDLMLPASAVYVAQGTLTCATDALQNADHDILKYLEALSGAMGANTSYAQLSKLIKRVPTEKETAKIISDLQAIDAGDVRPHLKHVTIAYFLASTAAHTPQQTWQLLWCVSCIDQHAWPCFVCIFHR
jgi:hypothetical protein